MVYLNMDSYVGLLLRSSIINVASAVMGVDGWIFENKFHTTPNIPRWLYWRDPDISVALPKDFCRKILLLNLGILHDASIFRMVPIYPIQVSKSTLLATSEKFCTAALNSSTLACNIPRASSPNGIRMKSVPFPSNGPVQSTA